MKVNGACETTLLDTFLSFHAQLQELEYRDGKVITVDGKTLGIPAIVAAARYPWTRTYARGWRRQVVLSADPSVREGVEKSQEAIELRLKAGGSVYGVNTGIGGSSTTRSADHRALSLAITEQLHIGVLPTDLYGEESGAGEKVVSALKAMPRHWVRGALLIRSNSLIRGHSGVRWRLIESIVDLLNKDITPLVPVRGSISASGDLSPLSYVVGTLIGHPNILVQSPIPDIQSTPSTFRTNITPSSESLALHGLEPIVLALGYGFEDRDPLHTVSPPLRFGGFMKVSHRSKSGRVASRSYLASKSSSCSRSDRLSMLSDGFPHPQAHSFTPPFGVASALIYSIYSNLSFPISPHSKTADSALISGYRWDRDDCPTPRFGSPISFKMPNWLFDSTNQSPYLMAKASAHPAAQTSSKSLTKSSASSSLSRKATAVKNVVKKGARAVARPFKKLKRTLSSDTTSSVAGDPETSSQADAISRAASTEPDEVINVSDDDQPDPEKELEALKRTWRSPIYSFFKSEVSVQYHEGRPCHFFPCAARKCKTTLGGVRRFQDSKDKASTANLRHHAIRCFGEEAVKTSTNTKDTSGDSGSIFSLFAHQGQQPVHYSHCSHSNPEVRARLVKWITENNRPANIINDEELRNLLTAGRPHISIPSSSTLSCDVSASFEKCRERVGQLLRDHPGRLHFATDSWTSPNHRAFVAWTVHLQHEGEMLAFLLDIIEIPESHSGKALAKAFQAMLLRFEITDKVLAVNANNATPNNTQVKDLAAMSNSFDQENHVHCFNHTLQLSAKELSKPFYAGMSSKSGSDEEETDDCGEMPELCSLNDGDDKGELGEDEDDSGDRDDAEDDIDELDTLSESERAEILADTAVVRQAISKVQQLSFAIIHSTTIALPAWRRSCDTHNLKPNLLPRDVVTRWNSTHDMMQFALKYRKPIDSITADKTLKKLRKFELDDEEWKIISELVSVLGKYKTATLFFSRDMTCVASVIPAMDTLSNTLNPDTNESYHPSILAAMKLARKKMDRYYSLTDFSATYRIAMVLHPGLKLEYFRQHEWQEEWIEQAENMVREEYIGTYEDKTVVAKDSVETTDKVGSAKGIAEFANISVDPTTAPKLSEIDEYLRLPVENVADPLKWWYNNRRVYPNLSRMALDYLCIPATSTAVERVFSKGRHLLPFTRNQLSPSSIRAYLCLGSWSRQGLLSIEDFLKSIRVKSSKRKRDDSDVEVIA